MAKLTYEEACSAMQAGVMLAMQLDPKVAMAKDLRVGINSAMSEHGALVALLIQKGVIGQDEYLETVAQGMRCEVALQERVLSEKLGKPVTLGFDASVGRGFAQIGLDRWEPKS